MERLIEKKTGTYADTLEAIGVASLLQELGYRSVTILDQGPHFSIRTSIDVLPNLPESLTPGYPYIWESSKENRPDLEWVVDYEQEKQKRDAQKKQNKKVKAALESQDVESLAEPVPEVAVATMLASMRMTWDGDRELAKWIHAHPAQTVAWAASSLDLSYARPTDVPVVSNSQILNPIAGKGVHAAKTKLRSAGSLPPFLVNSFSEWMKVRGLWRAMLLYRVDKDFKFFVLEPADIPLDQLERIRRDLQALKLWGKGGGVRLDIDASLKCIVLLIEQSDAVSDNPGPIRILRRRPRSVVRGLRQDQFMSLGKAAALINDAFFPLPDWFSINDRGDAEAYLGIIDEAIGKGGCLNSLQEKNSDDGRILQQYREWLLSGGLMDLLIFHTQFAVHLMARLASKDWARPFGSDNLDKLLIRGYDEVHSVKEIIENEGFQSIGRAVRNATIYALTIKSLRREVRFGLAQKWKQKIKAGNDDFAAAVAEFIQDYNWETVNRLEGKGHMVTTQDLDSFFGLLQRRGAELVGLLLLAYGFARAPKVDTSEIDRPAA